MGRIVICSGRGFTHWCSRWHMCVSNGSNEFWAGIDLAFILHSQQGAWSIRPCDQAATEMQRAENRQHLQSNTHGWHLKYSIQHLQRLNIEHTYTAHASFHTELDSYVMAVGHNNTTVDNIQYAAHSTISTRQLKSTTRTLNITTRT